MIRLQTAGDVAALRSELQDSREGLADSLMSEVPADLLATTSFVEFSQSPPTMRVRERIALLRQIDTILTTMIQTFVSGPEKVDDQPELFDTAPFASQATQAPQQPA